MIGSSGENPFAELPEALVEELLAQCSGIGEELTRTFTNLNNQKAEIRSRLDSTGLLKSDSVVSTAPCNPTSCAVDGSFAVEKLLCTDMTAVAAVAVEGLTPPSEKRYWPTPRHLSKVLTVPHNEATSLGARAAMICMELQLATKAPHDVVFLDGSLVTPIIYLNQALSRQNEVPSGLRAYLESLLEEAMKSYNTILRCERTDLIYVAVPKYTTKKEISRKLSLNEEYEDRGLLTFVLESGEFVGPEPIEPQAWHMPSVNDKIDKLTSTAIQAVRDLFIVYYRPYDHFPAIRLEISKNVALNPQRLAVLFESLRLQCGSPSIMEPFPLYMADRMVKHLSTGLPAIRQSTTQEMAMKWEGNLGNMYLAMHGYRTES